jgi:hypothetical protein
MKKVKQWEKPEVGVVARSSSREGIEAPGRGRDGYSIGPTPAPAPSTTDVIRRDSTRSFLGIGPLPPVIG